MAHTGKYAPKLRLQVNRSDDRIVELKSPSGSTIGYVVFGSKDGPNLLIAGTGEGIRSVIQRVLLKPEIKSIKGKLALLFLDRLESFETQTSLDSVAKCMRPITDTLFLNPPSLEVNSEVATTYDALIETVLKFCAKHGMVAARGHAIRPIICDYAS